MTGTVRDHVAGVLRAEMARRKLTQREMGARCGRSHQWVTDRLNGKTPCNVDDLELLASVLGIPVAQFLPAPERAA